MVTMRSLAFTPEAQDTLERYQARVNAVFRAHPSVNADELEREIQFHIEAELSGAPAPITAPRLHEVIERLGDPRQWVPDEELAACSRS